jgi:hypothetical protein
MGNGLFSITALPLYRFSQKGLAFIEQQQKPTLNVVITRAASSFASRWALLSDRGYDAG